MRGILALAACSIIAATVVQAQAAPTQPGEHGLFDSGEFPPDAAGIGSGGSGGDYTLPAATATTLGGVKIGSGVNATADGTISVTLPDLSQYLTASAASTTYLPLSSSAAVTAHAPTFQYYFAGANGGYNYIRGTSSNTFDIGVWESTASTGVRVITQNGTALQVNDKIYADLAVQNSAIPTANPGTNSHFVCVDDAGDFFRSDTACH